MEIIINETKKVILEWISYSLITNKYIAQYYEYILTDSEWVINPDNEYAVVLTIEEDLSTLILSEQILLIKNKIITI